MQAGDHSIQRIQTEQLMVLVSPEVIVPSTISCSVYVLIESLIPNDWTCAISQFNTK